MDIISAYTRKNALDDGVVFDVSYDKGAAVYNTAVFVTAGVHAALSKGAGKDPETYSARLWDVAWMVSRGREIDAATRVSTVKVGARRITVRGECGPVDIDDPRPAITLGFPEEF